MKPLLCFFASLLFFTATAMADDRTNVVLIMADDVGWEAIGCYGAEDYETPHIDAMAENGIRFNHCYSTPICTPSRVMIMTGKYNFRNYTHFGYLDPKEKTFGNLLQEAGYKTAIAGKWQLNGLYNQLPGHDDNTRPFRAGFDEYSLWQLTKEKKDGGERFWSPMIEQNGEVISAEENAGKYGPDLFCDFLCDFMERNQEEPFFVYYPMVLVHSPFVHTPDTIGDIPRDAKANRAPKAEAKQHFQAMVHYMDKIIGRLIQKTEDLGIAENTLFVFTADNGTSGNLSSRWNGREIQGGKGTMTNLGTHVAMVAYQKGMTPAGTVLDDLVDFTDVYPTLAEVAGVELGESDPIDGRSFLPQLKGEEGNPRDWVLCHYQPYWNKRPGQWARTAEFKLYRDGSFFQPAEDMKEQNDLSGRIDNEAVMSVHQQLQELLEQAPPAPRDEIVGKEATDRPIHADWPQLPK
ncbi:MAG: sulfatase-like hydrolase/transferase [Verrucomicrobiota bacterium]